MNTPGSIEATAALLRKGAASPTALVNSSLQRIQQRSKVINAFISVQPEKARQTAQLVESGIRDGRLTSPLAGMPVAVKDIIDIQDEITTAGCELYAEQVATEDATVVNRLRRAGAVIVGKTNLHELAYGTSSVNRFFGPVANPWDPKRHPGGSSGGSAAAVADGQVFGALGTDTGGSVRIPAACCGVVGLKPTSGRVSRHGVQPLSWSHDHVGPIARTVRDVAVLYEVLAGQDARDLSTVAQRVGNSLAGIEDGVRETRIGVLSDVYTGDCDPQVEAAVSRATSVLRDQGALVSTCKWDECKVYGGFAFVLIASEATARYLGPLATANGKISADIAEYISFGKLFLAHQYVQAQRAREHAVSTAAKIFEQYDALLLPTVPDVTERIEDLPPGFGRRHQYTIIANFLGLPAISVPCGFDSAGMPIGLQLIGPAFGESTLLRVARAYERAAQWSMTPTSRAT